MRQLLGSGCCLSAPMQPGTKSDPPGSPLLIGLGWGQGQGQGLGEGQGWGARAETGAGARHWMTTDVVNNRTAPTGTVKSRERMRGSQEGTHAEEESEDVPEELTLEQRRS